MPRFALLFLCTLTILAPSPPSLAAGKGNNKQAQEFLKELIERKTKPSETSQNGPASARGKDYLHHEEALQLVSQNRLEEAAAVYEEIVLDSPDEDEAYLLLGHTYLLSGKYQKAEEAFGNAIHIRPENTGEILPFYQNLALQDPDNDKNQTYLGYVFWMLGDASKAKEAFEEALRINPENSDAQAGLQELQKQGKP